MANGQEGHHEFNNRAGLFLLDEDGSQASLSIMFAPGFDEDSDMLSLDLINLEYLGHTNDSSHPDGTGTFQTFRYKFGPKGSNKNSLRINLNTNDVHQYRWGGFELYISGLEISRIHDSLVESPRPPANRPYNQEPGFPFYEQLNNALQAEARRQASIRAIPRQQFRNVSALQQTVLGTETPTTGANWYYGPRQAVPNIVKSNGPGSLIASFLSGERGNISTQKTALKNKGSTRRRRGRRTA